MTAKPADGDLLIELTGPDRSRYLAPRGDKPREGTQVTLWRLPGQWAVWSPGPQAGTWWVRAQDATAREIVEQITARPDRGYPVAQGWWKDCLAVKSRDIHPGRAGGVPRA